MSINKLVEGSSPEYKRSIAELIVDIQRMQTFHTAAKDINEWADQTFPSRTDQSMYLKLYSEIAEMIDAPPEAVGGEIADVFIMLLDFAERRKVDLPKVIAAKMAINRRRTWKSNHLGAWSHVK